MNLEDKTKEQLSEEVLRLHGEFAELKSRLARLEQGVDERAAELAGANERLKAEVAERKQVELGLRLSEEKYRALVENINDVIFSLDPNGYFTYVSPAVERVALYRADEFIGQPFDRFVHPDDLAELWERFRQTLNGHVEPFEFRALAKDGGVLNVSASSRPMWDDGRLVGVTGIMTDVTDRKRAEAALCDSEARFRALMDVLPDPLVVYDPQGAVTYVNTAFVQTYGWSLEELVGKPIDFVPRGEEEKTRKAWERTMRQERFLMDTKRYTKDKKLLDIEASTAVLLDREGKHTASLVIHRDVSERKRAEKALQKAHAELESFSYSVSHDLRAPLRGIDGWSLALLEDCGDRLDEQGRKYLQLVRSETQRMGKIIDDLLALSRVTRIEMRREQVDLSNLVHSIVSGLQDAEPERQVELVVQPGLAVCGDARLLEIMLSNLLSNAWKFTGNHASARIEFGRTELEGETAYFVRDDGAGFDMTYAKKLFGAFQRMHRPSEFPGSGVGLATVRRIVHRHGGRVWAEAEVERGASFYFTL